MCVIAVIEAEEQRPTEKMVRDMWFQNPSGGGVAWREIDGEGEPFVIWQKGLNLPQMLDHAKDLPVPFVLHFRIPSVGVTDKELTHPFPLSDDVELDLTGAAHQVLFHNGTWNKWKTELDYMVGLSRIKLPPGHYSDSRAMAFLAHHFGTGYLDQIDEKIVVFGAEEIEYYGRGWSLTDNDLCVSNTYWERTSQNQWNRSHLPQTYHNQNIWNGTNYEWDDEFRKPIDIKPTDVKVSEVLPEATVIPPNLSLVKKEGGAPEESIPASASFPATPPFLLATRLYEAGGITQGQYTMVTKQLTRRPSTEAVVMAQLRRWEFLANQANQASQQSSQSTH